MYCFTKGVFKFTDTSWASLHDSKFRTLISLSLFSMKYLHSRSGQLFLQIHRKALLPLAPGFSQSFSNAPATQSSSPSGTWEGVASVLVGKGHGFLPWEWQMPMPFQKSRTNSRGQVGGSSRTTGHYQFVAKDEPLFIRNHQSSSGMMLEKLKLTVYCIY